MSLVDCCRLCLKNLEDASLDKEGHYTIANNYGIQRMIFECYRILVTDNEIISSVCSPCYKEMCTVDTIRKRVTTTDLEIKQYYASLIVKQESELEEVLDYDQLNTTADESEQQQIENLEIEQYDDVSITHEDNSDSENVIGTYEFIEIQPNFEYDQTSMDIDASGSQSENEHSYTAAILKSQKATPKKEGRKVDSNCYICQTELDTVDDLDRHISSHVGSTKQECHLCQLPVSTVRHLNMHLRRNHYRKGKRIPCELCKKNNVVREFSSNFKVQAHIRAVHEKIVETPEKKFVCSYCGKSFSRGTHLRLHENTHTKAIMYKCNQCSFSATSRSGLYRHERIHTAEKPFKCDECDASFNQSNALNSHKLARHSNERPYSCEICGHEKRFKSKYILQNHMRTHERTGTGQRSQLRSTILGTEITLCERELKCNFCPAVYSWEKFLCRHIVEKHPEENVKMLSCEMCQKLNKSVFFLTQNEKDRHLEKHKKETKLKQKKRVCPDCGEVYHTSDTYQRHRQTHFNNDCKDCGKTFATRKTLRLHLLTVHLKSKPYKCDKCDSSFGQFTSLSAHMKIHQRPLKH